jgi:BTB/POZ domain
MIFVWKVEDTRFTVHEHFLSTYSSVFRDLLLLKRKNNNANDNRDTKSTQNGGAIYLDNVTVLEFESLLTFFYERYVGT